MRNETELLESKELRNQLVERMDVLEKVKSLILISNTELSTIKQVSQYYEVSEEAIKTIVFRHEDELLFDGIKKLSGVETKEYLVSCNLQPTNFKGYFEADGLKFANKTNTLIPRRAILRIGMLLRDSLIAKEIRTQLLNIEEKTTTETKLLDINEEQKLQIEVGMAYGSGNPDAIIIATTNYMNFKNRHIKKLEKSNEALANGILEWEDRSRINFAVRKLAQLVHKNYGTLWNELYKQLKNKYHMDLKARGKQPWLQHVKEEEWNNVVKSFSALCLYYKKEPSDLFCDLKVESQEVSTNA
jgi:hypothetical protein